MGRHSGTPPHPNRRRRLDGLRSDRCPGSNEALQNVDGFSALTSVGDLYIANNITLPTCQAELLRDNIGTENIAGAVDIRDNDDRGMCP